ncbi:MAG: peptidoglycan DD-metalloendopeptidase family protein [Pseudomonadota bacterium]|nr:peptidoglycan DD-metalloendopeptidase family protein [Pseudomonadota bacterium]HJO35030.1 peptidoglycan DD-metalloendopeptidase family protein [Gammaproteobacteria bacterium]
MPRRSLTSALLALCCASLLVACGGNAVRWQDRVHRVQPGETLLLIADRYDLSPAQLARWNGLANPNRIYVGQVLRLSPPPKGTRPAPVGGTPPVAGRPAGDVPPAVSERPTQRRVDGGPSAWFWPTDGRLVGNFATGRKGIDIVGEEAQPVRAAAGGRVMYSGSGLSGFGRLIIVKHSEAFLSAYAYNKELFVREGDEVEAGQAIASMGSGRDGQPTLHFQIRVDGNPVDPLAYLPAR